MANKLTINRVCSSKTLNKNAWTEEQEDEITRLACEFKEKITEETGRLGNTFNHVSVLVAYHRFCLADEALLVDEVWQNLIESRSRSRIAVHKKMKEMGIITVSCNYLQPWIYFIIETDRRV